MNPSLVLRIAGVAGLGSLICTCALAQDGGYAYGGLSIGLSRAKIDDQRIAAGLLGAGLVTTSIRRDESEGAVKLFGGYQFNPNFALEAGYFNLGRFGFNSTTVPAGTLDGRIRLQGVNMDLVGSMPVSERWSVLGRLGAQYASAHDTFRGTGAVGVFNPNPSKRELNYKLGIGLQYAINDSMLVRGEAERYRVNDAVGNHGGVNVLSVSLVFPFGRSPAPSPRAMAAPVYVARAPEPAPAPASAPLVAQVAPAPVPNVVLPAPLPPARTKVSFTADSLFAFDQSVVGPQGRTALDTFARDLAGIQFDVVTVEGHTDRLGSHAYNQKLSIERAASVKAYLVTSGHLDGAKITTAGKGEDAPVTMAADCKGKAATAALITCLQPDRRVDVEVSGMR